MNSVIWVGPKMNGIPRFFSPPWFLANWHENETVGMQRRKLKKLTASGIFQQLLPLACSVFKRFWTPRLSQA